MKIEFIGSVGIITRSPVDGPRLFTEGLGLPLERAEGSAFLFTDKMPGSKYFGVWPLSEAAKACFGSESWPADRPIPQVFFEFEVSSRRKVAEAASELASKGYAVLHPPRTDPWGQTVVRLQTDDGVIVGISYVPWMHQRSQRRTKKVRRSRR